MIFHEKDRDITLVPVADSRDRQAVAFLRAVKDSTLLVTMLTGESHPEPGRQY